MDIDFGQITKLLQELEQAIKPKVCLVVYLAPGGAGLVIEASRTIRGRPYACSRLLFFSEIRDCLAEQLLSDFGAFANETFRRAYAGE